MRDNGVQSIYQSQGPQLAPAPRATLLPPSLENNLKKTGEASSDTKQYLNIYLYIYIYFRKEQFKGQEGSRPQAASFCLLHRIFCYVSVENHLQKYRVFFSIYLCETQTSE